MCQLMFVCLAKGTSGNWGRRAAEKRFCGVTGANPAVWLDTLFLSCSHEFSVDWFSKSSSSSSSLLTPLQCLCLSLQTCSWLCEAVKKPSLCDTSTEVSDKMKNVDLIMGLVGMIGLFVFSDTSKVLSRPSHSWTDFHLCDLWAVRLTYSSKTSRLCFIRQCRKDFFSQHTFDVTEWKN